MTKNNFFTLLLLCSATFASAQSWKFGIKAHAGYNFIWEENFNAEWKGRPGGNLGGVAEKKLSEHSSLTIEALWVQMETIYKSGEGNWSSTYKDHNSFLGIPVSYRYSKGRFGLSGGIQLMVGLLSATDYNINIVEDDVPLHSEGRTVRGGGGIDYGPKVGVDYQLNDHFRLSLDYYAGVSGLISNSPFNSSYQQLSLGGIYFF